MPENQARVIIVGAGLAGIGAAYYLSRRGIPYLMLEKSDRAGGIWSSLKWPGMRCDTEIINYSYRFRPFTSDHYLVSGRTVAEYLQETADELQISENIRFETRVLRAEFSRRSGTWQVFTDKGVFESRFLVNANGYFSDQPHVPAFEGIDRFRGTVRHLFEIDDSEPLEGRRIVLVGSGASAISAAPALAERAELLTLLQRSPSYIYEQDNNIGACVDIAQRLYHAGFPSALELVNYLLQLKYDLVFVLFRKMPWLGKLFFRWHWRGVVDRRTYERHFRPAYNPWEQRIPVALGLKKLIRDQRIRLVTGHIARFNAGAILLADGRRIDADLCLLATGFELEFFRFEIVIDGQPLDTRGINFYKGMMMGGIPNYFQPFGPPHTSFTRRIETVSRLIVEIISHMQRHGLASVEIERKPVSQVPRIRPNYIMRDLSRLPAFHGSFELPSIDNLLCYRFREGDYLFSAPRDAARREEPKSIKDARRGASRGFVNWSQ